MPKESEEENESEKELEEEIQETEKDIDDNNFVEFLQISTEPNKPILDKVKDKQDIETLEQNISSTIISKKEETKKNYSIIPNTSNYSEQNTKTEQEYQTDFSPPELEPVKISKELQSQEFLDPMEGRMISPQNNLNQKMIETKFIKRNTKLPFEKDEIEYKDIRI